MGEHETAEEKQRKLEDKERSRQIERVMGNAHNAEQQINKLLLLGAGESGKSTLFKQMITIYGKGYPESERKTFTPIIHNNIITSVKILGFQTKCLSDALSEKPSSEVQELIDHFLDLEGVESVDENRAKDITKIWKDAGIQAVYELRSQFQFPDSAAYFFSEINRIGEAGYIPTQQDVLRSRVRTTGIVETSFEIDGNQFKMFDVGGQRNERKKWIHCFEDVSCVVFVAAISEYDQTLFEDDTTNRVVEALNLFDEICNSRWFGSTSVILFLNKRDLFMEKIARTPLSVGFDDYEGIANDYDAGCEFLREKFESRNRHADKEIYTHVTCATDSTNISHVFDAVKDIILKQSLRDGGLI